MTSICSSTSAGSTVRRVRSPNSLHHRPELLQPFAALAAGQPRRASHHLQHLPHLHELLEEPVDFFDARAASARNALPSAAVDDVVTTALHGRHRIDDRLDTENLPVVDFFPLL